MKTYLDIFQRSEELLEEKRDRDKEFRNNTSKTLWQEHWDNRVCKSNGSSFDLWMTIVKMTCNQRGYELKDFHMQELKNEYEKDTNASHAAFDTVALWCW